MATRNAPTCADDDQLYIDDADDEIDRMEREEQVSAQRSYDRWLQSHPEIVAAYAAEDTIRAGRASGATTRDQLDAAKRETARATVRAARADGKPIERLDGPAQRVAREEAL